MSCYAFFKGLLLPSKPTKDLYFMNALPTEIFVLGPYCTIRAVSHLKLNLLAKFLSAQFDLKEFKVS